MKCHLNIKLSRTTNGATALEQQHRTDLPTSCGALKPWSHYTSNHPLLTPFTMSAYWEHPLVDLWVSWKGQICTAHVGLAVSAWGLGLDLPLSSPLADTMPRLLWLLAVLHSGLTGR